MTSYKVFKSNNSKIPDNAVLNQEVKQRVNRKDIYKVGQGHNTIVYQVPEGKMFILLSAYLFFQADNASGGGDSVLHTGSAGINDILKLTCDSPPAGQTLSDAIIIPFGDGLRFGSGQYFKLFAGGGHEIIAGVYGYEIDLKDLEYLNKY